MNQFQQHYEDERASRELAGCIVLVLAFLMLAFLVALYLKLAIPTEDDRRTIQHSAELES